MALSRPEIELFRTLEEVLILAGPCSTATWDGGIPGGAGYAWTMGRPADIPGSFLEGAGG